MKKFQNLAIISGILLIIVLLYLLTAAAGNNGFFEHYYSWLLFISVAVALILLILVLTLLLRLYQRYRRGEFGTRLMKQLIILFVVIAVVPVMLVYLVSLQFVSRSIESWFNVQVESALASGITLGQTTFDMMLNDLQQKARLMTNDLTTMPESAQFIHLARWRDQYQLTEATIVSASGHLIATENNQLNQLLPDLPSASMLKIAKNTDMYAAFESLESKSMSANILRLRVIRLMPTPTTQLSLEHEPRYLQLIQNIPDNLANNAEALRIAYSAYQERALARSGLRKIYLLTLTLTLILTLFAALVIAFLFARYLAQPLLLLAEGTMAVAAGDLSPRPIIATNDELGVLTQSFNKMTQQLLEMRQSLQNANTYLESVLENMSAGVMVLDQDLRLMSCNDSVTRILQKPIHHYLGKKLSDIPTLKPLTEQITASFEQHDINEAAFAISQHWQKQIHFTREATASQKSSSITIFARGTRLSTEQTTGYLIVFDDISELISAQRSLAWGEVAQRLAHEIKNPLTPIQLSAERLQLKLADKLSSSDQELLKKASTTIINQVQAMQTMVDDFRDYAKANTGKQIALNLNALLEDVMNLYTNEEDQKMIHLHLTTNLPLIQADAGQVRQVIHNLLQNAKYAVSEKKLTQVEYTPRIDIYTEYITQQTTDGNQRNAVRLGFIDNGPGFAPEILKRAFEPYVTSKPRGTGLGLPMVKRIIDSHNGQINIQNYLTSDQEIGGVKISILWINLGNQA